MLNNEPTEIGIDFDKTICYNDENFNPLEPIEGAREAIIELKASGFPIVIFTARPYADKQLIKDWLSNFDIPYDNIICGKPLFLYIIDDRNLEFRNWKQVMEDLKHKEMNDRT